MALHDHSAVRKLTCIRLLDTPRTLDMKVLLSPNLLMLHTRLKFFYLSVQFHENQGVLMRPCLFRLYVHISRNL